MKRKAQSEIITTILLILIVLAAVVVVWMVISRFLNTGDTASCSKVQLRVVRATAGDPGSVTMNRLAGSPDVEVGGMKIIVDGTAYDVAGGINELETEDYSISLNVGERVQVAPILVNSAGANVTCNPVGETVVQA